MTRAAEDLRVAALLSQYDRSAADRARVEQAAAEHVVAARARMQAGGVASFLGEFGLSTREGVALMCIAEALLRIPDAATADRLIADKLAGLDFEAHLGHGDSLLVNASTYALMMTGRVVGLGAGEGIGRILGGTIRRLGEPVVRTAMRRAMAILGRQFVLGRTIEEALGEARSTDGRLWRYSFDMLGEGARTAGDAERNLAAYHAAIAAIGAGADGAGPVERPGISVKLSAIHPRFEFAQGARVMAEVVPRLAGLAAEAARHRLGLTVDAEEAERLALSLDVLARVAGDPALAGWDGLGLAVQAYQLRAAETIERVVDLARDTRRRIMVRLVKGAYWDTEIKRAQERGLDHYPVFTRKASTDLSYLVCAKRLLDARAMVHPQFATHNAHTIAAVLDLAGGTVDGFEFQRLHGMGDALYHDLVRQGVPVRVYAPVGSHEALLPYLVRRLLENGANTSFVNQVADRDANVAAIVSDPATRLEGLASHAHPLIPLPRDLFQPERVNSRGHDLNDTATVNSLRAQIARASVVRRAVPPRAPARAAVRAVSSPSDGTRVLGEVVAADAACVDAAISQARTAQPAWDAAGPEARAACLVRAADLLEEHTASLLALLVHEAGKTLPDAVAELREAVDFCRYYAAQAQARLQPQVLPGPTGEANSLSLHGRGVFVAISPWNFPLAIFLGQVAAALVAGNAVLAKPADQTPLIAAHVVALLHRAGVPEDVVQLLPGPGATVGARLVADPRTAGVVFTGSTATARGIAQALAARDGPIVPLVAETGGQNAMIVDASALSEQVVDDVVTSAFRSAGQRCSALRVLFLAESVADGIERMLAGAMAELKVGPPGEISTDVGPVIDADARDALALHVARVLPHGGLIGETPLPRDLPPGFWFAPRAVRLDRADRLTHEVFGPVVHVIRFADGRLDQVLSAVEAWGYGLTLGIHSRIQATIAHIHGSLGIGNTYVNRNMIGAVVGSQPFGGEGLSGTGPKAGGPHYVQRFATERTLSVNTTAMGINPALTTLPD
ncbi:bifunctional proline dehydrogenase/L-glutamate gamma-semialdehyde dehydrogenase PutA [Zavarzinia sp. CC-PAN008]|uniref:bifunctional proline dehydrogenase/L-glutamate gamma-semialdehyde dehydrogenase PutA n=1 Tax=Zavarzinia sp. CC-PAN008 TaxID=3243332 RepID=UPI003F74A086